MRLQLALNVHDIDAAVAYYSKLFNTEPHKRRDEYANFAIDSPPLKLVLFENATAREHLNHIGVEVFTAEEVTSAQERLDRAGILGEVQRGEVCCHAAQDKVWSKPFDGLSWEWYRIVDDDPASTSTSAASACCAGDGEVQSCCQET